MVIDSGSIQGPFRVSDLGSVIKLLNDIQVKLILLKNYVKVFRFDLEVQQKYSSVEHFGC